MCNARTSSKAGEGFVLRTKRRRLWEAGSGYQCSILGTCLSLERAKKILIKGKLLKPGSNESDYEVHCVAVSAAQRIGPVAKLLDKALERAHEGTVRRYNKYRTLEELRDAWRSDAAEGAIPGAYWAVMTHPLATAQLMMEAFGVIHMLGHRLGAGNRERLRGYDRMETQVECLERRLGEERARHREEREALLQRVRLLEAEQARTHVPPADTLDRSCLSVSGPGGEEEIDIGRGAALRAERRLNYALNTIEALREEEGHLRSLIDQHRETLESAEASLELSTTENGEAASECCHRGEACEACDLRGCVVLYVGGDRGMLPHLRRVAHAANSELLHHDGGLEDGLAALPRLCTRADVVLCPMDRVSHVAVHKVKRACTSAQKRFIPLRRASLEAFEGGLRQLATEASG